MKNTDNVQYERKASNATDNGYFSLSAKMNGAQRKTLVSLKRMHLMYCGMIKGTFWAKIKPVSLTEEPINRSVNQ